MMSNTTNLATGADTELATRWRVHDGPMDSETAMQLRAHLAPLFERAESWDALRAALGACGFALAIRGGRLTVIERRDGCAICTAGWLGTPLSRLSRRLGRPCIRALPGSDAAGEFPA